MTTTAPTDNTSTAHVGLPKLGWTREKEKHLDSHAPLTPLPVGEVSAEEKGEMDEGEVVEGESSTHMMVCQVQAVTSSSWSVGGNDVGQDGTRRVEEDHEETKC